MFFVFCNSNEGQTVIANLGVGSNEPKKGLKVTMISQTPLALPKSGILSPKSYDEHPRQVEYGGFSALASKPIMGFNPIPPGLFEGGSAWKRGGGWKVPAAYNSKTINDNEMKFAGVVKGH